MTIAPFERSSAAMPGKRGLPWGIPLVALAACTPPSPHVDGVAGVAPVAERPWSPPTPPPGPSAPTPPAPPPSVEVPPDLQARMQQLTLADVVDLGLRNNPRTQLAWANARAAAAAYGSARSAYWPSLEADASVVTLKTIASQGRAAVNQTLYGPGATLSFLLLDFGGRSGSVEGAKQALLAADWTHNAALQDVILSVELAFYQYLGNNSLLTSQRTTLQEAQENLAAAEERHTVGLSTIADVLQAKTAVSEAVLAVQTTEGTRQVARGSLALALGYPANLPYDIDSTAAPVPVAPLADSVESLISEALQRRPELAAARAAFEEAQARVRQARAARLPSVTLTGVGGYTYLANQAGGGANYNVGLGLSIPLFNGLGWEYNQQAAEAQANMAKAQTQILEQQVIFQVFSAYYQLQTATNRVATSNDLEASATQSLEVALGRYRAGVGTVLDLLAAQRALADARAQVVLSRFQWQTALAQVAHDAGVLDLQGGSPLRLVTDTATASPSR